MRKRRPNYRLVKIHRSYTVEEIARLFGTHRNIVRAWVKAGLPTCDGKGPILILGSELAGYLKARRTKTSGPASQEKSIACDAALRRNPPETWRSTSRLQQHLGT